VAHEIVDVMQQRLCLGEVGVAQQIDVEVRHSHRVDAGSFLNLNSIVFNDTWLSSSPPDLLCTDLCRS
jgi:hypothetical protein